MGIKFTKKGLHELGDMWSGHKDAMGANRKNKGHGKAEELVDSDGEEISVGG